MKTPDYKIDIRWVTDFRDRVLSAAGVSDVKELHTNMLKNVVGYDLKYQTINRILTGKREFPIQLLLQIQSLTKKSFAFLLTGKTEAGLDEEGIMRRGVQEFLAISVARYARKLETPKIRKPRKRA
jgi:hypothetical protein